MPMNAGNSSKPSDYRPEHLGKPSQIPIDAVDRIPWDETEIEITLVCDEFTSLCPVTKQPDFGTITIRYRPRRWLIETKSLKLYFWRFRNVGSFNEELVKQIARDLGQQIEPARMEVTGEFKSRGGISVQATARYEQP